MKICFERISVMFRYLYQSLTKVHYSSSMHAKTHNKTAARLSFGIHIKHTFFFFNIEQGDSKGLLELQLTIT